MGTVSGRLGEGRERGIEAKVCELSDEGLGLLRAAIEMVPAAQDLAGPMCPDSRTQKELLQRPISCAFAGAEVQRRRPVRLRRHCSRPSQTRGWRLPAVSSLRGYNLPTTQHVPRWGPAHDAADLRQDDPRTSMPGIVIGSKSSLER
jgi:hypothetical protein